MLNNKIIFGAIATILSQSVTSSHAMEQKIHRLIVTHMHGGCKHVNYCEGHNSRTIIDQVSEQ